MTITRSDIIVRNDIISALRDRLIAERKLLHAAMDADDETAIEMQVAIVNGLSDHINKLRDDIAEMWEILSPNVNCVRASEELK